jgi:acyl-CoA dehydrogenase
MGTPLSSLAAIQKARCCRDPTEFRSRMNINLTQDEQAFRDEVRSFLAKNLTDELRDGQTRTTGVYPDPEISRRWHRLLYAKGWAAPLWPAEHGGASWTPTHRFIFEFESARAGAPVISPFGVRLLGPVLIRYGTPEQQQRYLPRTASGDLLWCQGFSEPNAGSDLASLRTSAVRKGDGFLVNGTKIWTTQGHIADMMFALLRTRNTTPPHAGISFFVFDMKTPGITVRPIRSITGEHELNQVFFDDVWIPADSLIGPENRGWELARYLLEFERGAGLFSARHRSSFTRMRRALDVLEAQGVRVLDNPIKRAHFCEVGMAIDSFEMLELSVLGNVQLGQSPGPATSILKLRSSRVRQEIGQLAVELLGIAALEAHGTLDRPLTDDMLLRIATNDYLEGRAVTIFGGASEVQLELLSRDLFA